CFDRRPSSTHLTDLPQFPMTETIDHMIVHHAHRLHECVADRAPHELESSPFQLLAHAIGFKGPRWDFLDRSPGVLLRLVANESPNIPVETPRLILHGQE